MECSCLNVNRVRTRRHSDLEQASDWRAPSGNPPPHWRSPRLISTQTSSWGARGSSSRWSSSWSGRGFVSSAGHSSFTTSAVGREEHVVAVADSGPVAVASANFLPPGEDSGASSPPACARVSGGFPRAEGYVASVRANSGGGDIGAASDGGVYESYQGAPSSGSPPLVGARARVDLPVGNGGFYGSHEVGTGNIPTTNQIDHASGISAYTSNSFRSNYAIPDIFPSPFLSSAFINTPSLPIHQANSLGNIHIESANENQYASPGTDFALKTSPRYLTETQNPINSAESSCTNPVEVKQERVKPGTLCSQYDYVSYTNAAGGDAAVNIATPESGNRYIPSSYNSFSTEGNLAPHVTSDAVGSQYSTSHSQHSSSTSDGNRYKSTDTSTTGGEETTLNTEVKYPYSSTRYETVTVDGDHSTLEIPSSSKDRYTATSFSANEYPKSPANNDLKTSPADEHEQNSFFDVNNGYGSTIHSRSEPTSISAGTYGYLDFYNDGAPSSEIVTTRSDNLYQNPSLSRASKCPSKEREYTTSTAYDSGFVATGTGGSPYNVLEENTSTFLASSHEITDQYLSNIRSNSHISSNNKEFAPPVAIGSQYSPKTVNDDTIYTSNDMFHAPNNGSSQTQKGSVTISENEHVYSTSAEIPSAISPPESQTSYGIPVHDTLQVSFEHQSHPTSYETGVDSAQTCSGGTGPSYTDSTGNLPTPAADSTSLHSSIPVHSSYTNEYHNVHPKADGYTSTEDATIYNHSSEDKDAPYFSSSDNGQYSYEQSFYGNSVPRETLQEEWKVGEKYSKPKISDSGYFDKFTYNNAYAVPGSHGTHQVWTNEGYGNSLNYANTVKENEAYIDRGAYRCATSEYEDKETGSAPSTGTEDYSKSYSEASRAHENNLGYSTSNENNIATPSGEQNYSKDSEKHYLISGTIGSSSLTGHGTEYASAPGHDFPSGVKHTSVENAYVIPTDSNKIEISNHADAEGIYRISEESNANCPTPVMYESTEPTIFSHDILSVTSKGDVPPPTDIHRVVSTSYDTGSTDSNLLNEQRYIVPSAAQSTYTSDRSTSSEYGDGSGYNPSAMTETSTTSIYTPESDYKEPKSVESYGYETSSPSIGDSVKSGERQFEYSSPSLNEYQISELHGRVNTRERGETQKNNDNASNEGHKYTEHGRSLYSSCGESPSRSHSSSNIESAHGTAYYSPYNICAKPTDTEESTYSNSEADTLRTSSCRSEAEISKKEGKSTKYAIHTIDGYANDVPDADYTRFVVPTSSLELGTHSNHNSEDASSSITSQVTSSIKPVDGGYTTTVKKVSSKSEDSVHMAPTTTDNSENVEENVNYQLSRKCADGTTSFHLHPSSTNGVGGLAANCEIPQAARLYDTSSQTNSFEDEFSCLSKHGERTSLAEQLCTDGNYNSKYGDSSKLNHDRPNGANLDNTALDYYQTENDHPRQEAKLSWVEGGRECTKEAEYDITYEKEENSPRTLTKSREENPKDHVKGVTTCRNIVSEDVPNSNAQNQDITSAKGANRYETYSSIDCSELVPSEGEVNPPSESLITIEKCGGNGYATSEAGNKVEYVISPNGSPFQTADDEKLLQTPTKNVNEHINSAYNSETLSSNTATFASYELFDNQDQYRYPVVGYTVSGEICENSPVSSGVQGLIETSDIKEKLYAKSTLRCNPSTDHQVKDTNGKRVNVNTIQGTIVSATDDTNKGECGCSKDIAERDQLIIDVAGGYRDIEDGLLENYENSEEMLRLYEKIPNRSFIPTRATEIESTSNCEHETETKSGCVLRGRIVDVRKNEEQSQNVNQNVQGTLSDVSDQTCRFSVDRNDGTQQALPCECRNIQILKVPQKELVSQREKQFSTTENNSENHLGLTNKPTYNCLETIAKHVEKCNKQELKISNGKEGSQIQYVHPDESEVAARRLAELESHCKGGRLIVENSTVISTKKIVTEISENRRTCQIKKGEKKEYAFSDNTEEQYGVSSDINKESTVTDHLHAENCELNSNNTPGENKPKLKLIKAKCRCSQIDEGHISHMECEEKSTNRSTGCKCSQHSCCNIQQTTELPSIIVESKNIWPEAETHLKLSSPNINKKKDYLCTELGKFLAVNLDSDTKRSLALGTTDDGSNSEEWKEEDHICIPESYFTEKPGTNERTLKDNVDILSLILKQNPKYYNTLRNLKKNEENHSVQALSACNENVTNKKDQVSTSSQYTTNTETNTKPIILYRNGENPITLNQENSDDNNSAENTPYRMPKGCTCEQCRKYGDMEILYSYGKPTLYSPAKESQQSTGATGNLECQQCLKCQSN